MQNTKYMWDIGQGKMACKITKFMWFACLTSIFLITYDKFQESMANTFDNSELQNSIVEIDRLPIGIASHNKHALKITIEKKWPKNQTDLEEDTYESPQFV